MRTLGPAEDRKLLEALAIGDLSALEVLYDSYSAAVYQLLLLHTSRREDADDILQDVFISLVDRGSGVINICNPRAYLLKVAYNMVCRARSRPGPLQIDLQTIDVVDQNARTDEAAVDTTRIREAMSWLPVEQCEAVILKVWHGFTFAEMAEIFDIPINTAASRYRYGIEKLRDLLGDAGDE